MNSKLSFKKNKIVAMLMLMGALDSVYAEDPVYQGVGPVDSNNAIHIQNGNTVTASGWCELDYIDSFPGVHILYSHDPGCAGNTGIFACDGNEGSFANDDRGFNWVRKKCYGPERNFDITNNTGYPINSIYFDGDEYRTNPNTPTSSIWLVAQKTPPEGVRSTNFGGSVLAVDTDYGEKGSGIVGALTIQSDDLDESPAYSVAQAAVVQSNPKSPDGNYILTSSVPILNRGPHPVVKPIACVIPPANGQFSTSKDATGKAFLVPSIMEAKLRLCVNAPNTTNEYHFQTIPGLYHSLDTDNTKLYPKILDSKYETNFKSGYISEALTYTGIGGLKCSQYDFVVKTKASTCSDLQNNNKDGINSADITLAAYDTTGVFNNFTLKFISNITAGDNNVDAVYQLMLRNNSSASDVLFKFVGSGSDNTITCAHGICKGEIDYFPLN